MRGLSINRGLDIPNSLEGKLPQLVGFRGMGHIIKAFDKLANAYGRDHAQLHSLYDTKFGYFTLTLIDGGEMFQRRSRMQMASQRIEESTYATSPAIAAKVAKVAGSFAVSGIGLQKESSYLKDVAYEADMLRNNFRKMMASFPKLLTTAIHREGAREFEVVPAQDVFQLIKPALGRVDNHAMPVVSWVANCGHTGKIEYKFGAAVGRTGQLIGLAGVDYAGRLTRDYEGFAAEQMPQAVRADSQSEQRREHLLVSGKNFLPPSV